MTKFLLSDQFISQFIGKQPKWGPIGYVTYKRTYARDLDRIFPRHRELGEQAGLTSEEFWLTLTRVTEGTFTILRDHCRNLKLPWSEAIAQRKAQEFFLGMWEFRWTPPGRGLWTMGAPIVDKVGAGCLANCGFQSSQNIDVDFAEPFCSLMDFSMLGVGVGFDTRGAGKVRIQTPVMGTDTHVVSDDREGWVELLRRTLNAFVGVGTMPGRVDVSRVRRSGSPILGFGGTASGPEALLELYESIGKLLYAHVGQLITSSIITDIGNMIGRCVVAGNIRRSAEIVFGDPDDEPFMDLKDKTLHPLAVDGWRWASNNSILAKVGQSYDRIAKRIAKNGEPGLLWLENAQRYGRMGDPPNDKDARALGANPCVTADTVVSTSRGFRTVRDLVGTPFFAEIGDAYFNCMHGFFSTGFRPVYKLRLAHGHELRLTGDHRVLVRDADNELVARWVCAADLRHGDRVAISGSALNSSPFHSLTEAGYEEVFDCSVSQVHAFEANGIIVHNCNEQTLFDKELCVLVETYPFNHDDVKQYLRTLKFAYLYAKAVTLVPTHNLATNAVMMMNRRIGCSMSGTTQAMQKFGRRAFFDLCDRGYEYIQALDEEYSEWLCVPRSIKTTSVKPGGTTPLLAGILAGMSYPISEYYHRVIRFATNSPMLPALRQAGYQIVEIDQDKEPNTTAVYFPVKVEGYERGERDVSMWEQLEIAAALQAHWADNQVSVTVKFDRETEGPQIARALEFMETRLKGVSFLPHDDHGYEHAPYQAITREEYEDAVKTLRPLDLTSGTHEVTDAFCDGDKCVIPVPSQLEIKDAFDVLLIAKQRADIEIAALRAHDGPGFLERHAGANP